MAKAFQCLIYIFVYICTRGFPVGTGGKESACQCKRCRFDPWVRKIPWRRKWHLVPVYLLEKIQWTEEMGELSPWGPKESDTIEQLSTYMYVRMCIYAYLHTCKYVLSCKCIYISVLCICNYFVFTLMKIICLLFFFFFKEKKSRSWCPVSDAERSISNKGLDCWDAVCSNGKVFVQWIKNWCNVELACHICGLYITASTSRWKVFRKNNPEMI